MFPHKQYERLKLSIYISDILRMPVFLTIVICLLECTYIDVAISRSLPLSIIPERIRKGILPTRVSDFYN